VPAVHASYFTDPLCPWSWALEPALRILRREFGGRVRWSLVMGGLARDLAHDPERVLEWLEAGERGAMPVDPRLWSQGAPRSSFPACLAVEAAAEQGLEEPYLRRLRVGLLARRRKLDALEALVEEARGIEGMDLERFRVDAGSNWALERFAADLDRAAEARGRAGEAVGAGGQAPGDRAGDASLRPASDPGMGRVLLPSVEFRGEDGEVHGLYGFAGVDDLRAAARAAGAEPAPEPAPQVEEALRRLGPLAASEVAAVCDLPGPRAPAVLWRLALEWRVRPERSLTGELWSVA
jgi:predicted DsbA family dithiol-disulfide isomerase